MTKIFLKKKHTISKLEKIKNNELQIRLNELEFSVRALNSLTNQGVKTLGDLVCYKEKDLKTFPNMGQTSIDEIKEILNIHSLELGMDLNIKDTNNEILVKTNEEKEEFEELTKEIILELIKDFDETTLSVRSKNALRNMNCYYVGDILSVNKSELFRIRALGYKSILEIEDYILNLNLKFGDVIEPWTGIIIEELRSSLRDEISTSKKQDLIEKDKYLEVELTRILKECIVSPKKDIDITNRVIGVLNSRFGLDGSPAKTLEIIGQKYNVTRERIRQNQEYGLRKLKILKPITPILDEVFQILEKSLPLTEIELNKVLKEKNLTKLDWDFKGLQDFYESFGIKLDFYVSKINNVKIISKASIDNVFRTVMVNINKRISNTGLCSLSECLNFKEVYLNNLKRETIKRFIQTKSMFTWLDDEEEWFTFYSRRNRLSNLITKAATGSTNVEIDTLFSKIKNYHRLDKVKYSKNVFLTFCKNSFDCVISDTELLFSSPKSKISDYDGFQGNIIAPNEQKIIDIFGKFGPILSIDDLKELSEIAGVKKDSLNMMLQFSPLFNRIDIGFYELTKKIKASKVEKIISIINLESLNFSKDECPIVQGKKTYIEVNRNGKLIKSLPYERPLRLLPDGSYGVVYKKNVYPIANSLIENAGDRINTDLN